MARPDWLEDKFAEIRQQAAQAEAARRAGGQKQKVQESRPDEERRIEAERARIAKITALRSSEDWHNMREQLELQRRESQETYQRLCEIMDNLGVREMLLELIDPAKGVLPAKFKLLHKEFPPSEDPLTPEEIDSATIARMKQEERAILQLQQGGDKPASGRWDDTITQPAFGLAYGLGYVGYEVVKYRGWKGASHRWVQSGEYGHNRGDDRGHETIEYKTQYSMEWFAIGISQFRDSDRPHLFFEATEGIFSPYSIRTDHKRTLSLDAMSINGFSYDPNVILGDIQRNERNKEIENRNAPNVAENLRRKERERDSQGSYCSEVGSSYGLTFSEPYKYVPLGLEPFEPLMLPKVFLEYGRSFGIIDFVDDIDQSVDTVQFTLANMIYNMPAKALAPEPTTRFGHFMKHMRSPMRE